MRRRLLLTIVGTVVAALVLAGLGTLVLARLGARRYAENQLRQQVQSVTASLSNEERLVGRNEDRPRILTTLRTALRLDGVGLLTVGADGTVRGSAPSGITLRPLQMRELLAGRTISGRRGQLVYAADAVDRPGSTTVVILSNRASIAIGGAALWFALAGIVVIVLAVIVAERLSKRLTEPLRRAGEVSRRIADGDFSARVPEPPAGARDELADVSRSVNAMAEALQRSRGVEQQFLMSVSHDLRTPLTSIQGFAEALADGTAADAPHAGSVILAESRRLDRLVRDILELARLDARHFSMEIATVDLDDLVQACVEGFGPEAEAAGVSLDVVTRPSVVRADPDRLAQVVANLLDNALKFARGRVRVQVEALGARTRVTVADDGPGIEPSDRDHVFERLYVARHRPVRKESGSGLGLAIVRELVVTMGGTVGVDADPSGGARLWFELPSQDPPARSGVNAAVPR